MIEKTLEYMEVPRKYTNKELENLGTEIIVPDIEGLKIGEAGQILKELGLRYTTQYDIFTEDAIVTDHHPRNGKTVIKNSIVDLYLDSGEKDPLHNYNEETLDLMDAVEPVGDSMININN